jgi:PAS domain S-box-containing protein
LKTNGKYNLHHDCKRIMTLSTVDRHPSPWTASPGASYAFDVLRAAFEGLPNGVVLSDEDGTILFVNAPASAVFNYQPGELIGQPLSRLLPGVPAAHDDKWTEIWKNPRRAAIFAGRTITGIGRDGVTAPAEIGLSGSQPKSGAQPVCRKSPIRGASQKHSETLS